MMESVFSYHSISGCWKAFGPIHFQEFPQETKYRKIRFGKGHFQQPLVFEFTKHRMYKSFSVDVIRYIIFWIQICDIFWTEYENNSNIYANKSFHICSAIFLNDKMDAPKFLNNSLILRIILHQNNENNH